MIRALLDDGGLAALRSALAPFTPDGVDAALGLAGRAVLDRGDLTGARYALRGRDDAVAVLLRLFTLGLDVPESDARRALAPLDLEHAHAAGLVTVSAGSVRAALDIRPYAETGDDEPWWVVSDLGSDIRGGGPLPADHVLGIGSASLTLAQSTPRTPIGSALDVGTGCGIQALHLGRHSGRVTGTDISARALRMAATTAALSGASWDLREGSLLEPVAGDRFDLVVANPPFVVSPGDGGYDYRDSGLAGDDVCRSLVAGIPGLLTPGGVGQLLANWVIPVVGTWQERLEGWFADTRCDAWVWQREIADPAEYVALWLRDAGERPGSERYVQRYDAWCDWMAASGIAAVGMGLVTMWRTDVERPTRVFEDVPQAVAQPAGPHIAAWISRRRALRDLDDPHLLDARLVAAVELVRETADLVSPGAGWAPASVRLRQSHGMRWEIESDAAVAAVVAGCDGRTPLRTLVGVLAASLDRTAEQVTPALLPVVRDLVARGILDLSGAGAGAA